MYINELIHKDYEAWNSGDIVIINSGTGTGKSHFIRNELSYFALSHNRKILLICNRVQLKNQNIERVDEQVVTIVTYQQVEQEIISNKRFDFSPYTYVVCDECHYFTEDSSFNDNTNESFNAILGLRNHIRIFMSATGYTLFDYLKAYKLKPDLHLWEYKSPKNFNNIASLLFYNKGSQELVERFIQNNFPDNRDKIIWFCGSVSQAVELHNKYPNSSFLCSKAPKNRKYFKYLSDDFLTMDDNKSTFSGKFLFTTNVLDNGYDFIDTDIKMIVCDYFDLYTIIQCVGRKRMVNDNDKVHIILRNLGNQAVAGKISALKKIVKEADTIIKGDVPQWIEQVGKFGKNSNHIIMDVATDNKTTTRKQVSRPKYLKALSDYQIFKQIQEESRDLNKWRELEGDKRKNDGFMQYIKRELNQKNSYLLDEMSEKQDLSSYLHTISGKPLFKKEQQELIAKINARANGRQIKSHSALNYILQEFGFGYSINTRRDKRKKLPNGERNPNRDKIIWTIVSK